MNMIYHATNQTSNLFYLPSKETQHYSVHNRILHVEMRKLST